MIFNWGEYDGTIFTNHLEEVYDKIVYWRSNYFMLPTGNCGKQYIQELTRLINAWVDESSLKEISLKAIMVMPALLLQKPSRESKVKDHKEALTRRLALWEKGDLKSLLFEATTIQHTLSRSKNIKESTAQLSKMFVKKMQSGNINGAIKLLSNNMENGVLPLNEETLNLLYQKHPDASKAFKQHSSSRSTGPDSLNSLRSDQR